jgi:hypothetical protein
LGAACATTVGLETTGAGVTGLATATGFGASTGLGVSTFLATTTGVGFSAGLALLDASLGCSVLFFGANLTAGFGNSISSSFVTSTENYLF